MNLTVRAAARLLNVTEARIHEWVAQGELPAMRVPDGLRFSRVEVLEWAAARRIKVSPELFDEGRPRAPDGGRPAPPGGAWRLSQGIVKGGIHRGIVAADERAALDAIAGLLPLPPDLDRETLRSLFAARDSLAPVGGGIAIPHAQTPTVLPVAEPIVALGFLAQPIPVAGGPAGRSGGREPVSALFAVISRTVRSHLEVLSRIAFALSSDAVRATIAARASDDEILSALRSLESDR